MEIASITKTGLFYKIKFDDGNIFKFHESVIIKYGFIRKKITISEVALQNALKDNEYYLALDKGVNYLSSLKSKYDTYLYLRKTFSEVVSKRVIDKLIEMKLLNDLEFAKLYVLSMIKKQYGPNKIYEDLKSKRISDEEISLALSLYDNKDMEINCLKLMEKYLPTLKKNSSLLGKKKLQNYLLNKGFSNNTITTVIEKNYFLLDNINDEDELLKVHYQKLLKAKKSKDDKEFKNKAIRSLCSKGFPLSKVLKIVEGRNKKYDQRQN